jgi:imidazolonepropionase-like amidohydrolase
MRFLILLALLIALPSAARAEDSPILLRPARVFDGVDPRPHSGWSVLVRGERIEAVGPSVQAPAGARVVDLPA